MTADDFEVGCFGVTLYDIYAQLLLAVTVSNRLSLWSMFRAH